MSRLLEDFKQYLKAFTSGNIVKLPADDFNLCQTTVTNVMETKNCIFSTVHFLFGYDDGNEMFTTNLGYKFRYQNDYCVQYKLEYIAGNTFLFREFKSHKSNTIDYRSLYKYQPICHQDSISLFGWALDFCDKKLLKKCCNQNVLIHRADVLGDYYLMNGLDEAETFMIHDKDYYHENQYSLLVQKDDTNSTLAYHLYPANTGNKHLGSNTKYVQFFNEDVYFEFEDNKISKVTFSRKERPIVERNSILFLGGEEC